MEIHKYIMFMLYVYVLWKNAMKEILMSWAFENILVNALVVSVRRHVFFHYGQFFKISKRILFFFWVLNEDSFFYMTCQECENIKTIIL